MVKRSTTWIRFLGFGILGWPLLVLSLVWWTPRGAQVLGQAPQKAAAPQPPAPRAPAPPPVGPGGGPAAAGAAADDEPSFTDRVRLPVDRSANRKIERVKEWIQKEEWGDAVRLLQSILNSQEDVVLKDEQGRWVSVRHEANRILAELPRDGQQFYELEYGAQARAALKRGLASGDPKAYAETALRYMHTEAGAEANQLLGTYYLDQGCYIQAALCYERLLARPGMFDKVPPASLYKAALAFERAGETRNRDRAWNELTRKLDRPGEKPLPAVLQRQGLGRLKEALALKSIARPGRGRFDWPLFLGSVDRCAQSEGGAPFLEQRYHKETAFEAQTKSWLDQVTKSKSALLSGYHPLAVGDKLLFRSYQSVHCIDLKANPPSESWYANTQVSLDDLVAKKSHYDPTNQTVFAWANQYLQVAPAVFHDNSTLGTMSSDGAFIYFIEDLAIPPAPITSDGRAIMIARQQRDAPSVELQPWTKHNRLVALEFRREGAVAWSHPEIDKEGPDDLFTDTFFLGAPLPLGDRLYVLAETNAEIRLLCLDPANKGALDWAQPLCTVESRKLSEDPIRRTQAAHLAYGEGILVCPTNAGAIIGVDLLTRSLLWAHSYQELSDNPLPMVQPFPNRRGFTYSVQPLTQPSWTFSAPMIRDGRVVFTAPDGEAVHCLNLRDGTLAWKERRASDIYVAGVFRGKVLLVGRDLVRALSLQDGSELWKVEIGMPAGRGVANGTTYFLPLKSAEVWAIDIDTGKVLGKSRSPHGEVPGNLIFHEGDVISQTITGVTVYPQLAVREREITESLAKNPSDPKGLLDRGELRLHQGLLIPAVDDLRAALKNQLAAELQPRARTKLYEALGDLLEGDFAANENLLKEYEALSVLDAAPNETEQDRLTREREQRDRQARTLRLIAKGREGQGRLTDAFQAYMDFANLGREELIALPEDPSTKALPKVWAQGRIEAMIRKATPEQRQSLEEALDSQWRQAQAAGTLSRLRQFVNLFGSVSAQGRRARLIVAERLLQSEQLTDAEGELLILMRDAEPEIAAPALEALARLKTKLGELDDAARCYRALAQKYPKTVIRDGKTGEELYLELMTDKRFLPYVEELRRGWMGSHTIEPRPGTPTLQDGGMVAQLFWLEPEGGEAVPFFRRFRIGIDNNNRQVKRVDRTTGEETNLFALSGRMPTIYSNPTMQYRFRPGCHLRGQIMVFTWGHFVYACDLRQRDQKPLWSYDLLGSAADVNNRRSAEPNMQLMVNKNGGLDLLIANSSVGRIGTIGAVEAHCVCFLVRDEGLVAVDPLKVDTSASPPSPRKLWVKADVPQNAEMFSDGEHLYVLPIARSDQPPGRGYALRLADGTRVNIPDFASLYQRKQRILGRNLLLKEMDPKGSMTLRLYDVHTGRDAWTKTFAPQSILLQSVPQNLVGVVDLSGQLSVLEVESGKEVFTARVDSPPANAADGYLLKDDSQLYVALNTRDPNIRRDVYPPGPSLRSVPVNGNVYAFDQQNGQRVWAKSVPHQVLLIDQFEDLPILLFGCYQTQWIPIGGNPNQLAPQQGSAVLVLDKRNGEKIDDLTQQGRSFQLHTLKVDPRTGQVEVVGYQFRRSYVVNY